MTLPYRQERLLRRTDRALSRVRPHLASMLSIFARITAAERLPAWEQLRPRLTLSGEGSTVAGGRGPLSRRLRRRRGIQGRDRRAVRPSRAGSAALFWVTSRRLTVIRTLSKG